MFWSRKWKKKIDESFFYMIYLHVGNICVGWYLTVQEAFMFRHQV